MTRPGGAPLSAVGRTVLALLGFAARRLRSNPIHALTTLLGLSLTVGVITAVPLYADGMSTRLLREHLRASPGPLDLGVLIEHGASQLPEDPSTTLAEYRQADQILSQTIAANLAVAPDGIVRFVRSDNRHLLFTSDDPGAPLREGVPWGGLGAISDLAANVQMLEGRAAVADVFTLRLPSGALVPLVEAVASTDMLDAGGLVVGDQVQLRFGDPRALGTPPAIVAVDIVGRFAPSESDIPFWPEDAEELTQHTLFTPPSAFLNGLLSRYPSVTHPRLFDRAVWYAPLDAAALQAGSAGRTREGIAAVRTVAERVLPHTTLKTRLERALERFEGRLVVLTVALLALSVPIVVMVLGFMRLSVALAIERQRQEVALLRSRGVGVVQLVGVYLIEGLLVGAPALAVGLALGVGFAQAIGQTATFLAFDARAPLDISVAGGHVAIGVGAIGVSLAAMLGPVVAAARLSIVSAKQQASRSVDRPLYQRHFLDVLLLAAALAGLFLLRSVDALPGETEDDLLLADTLLVLVPILFIFAVSVFALRAFPYAVRALAVISSRVSGVSAFVALRQIGRSPAHYTSLVLLLSLTFALGAFSASFAATIDRNIIDRVYFATGADAQITESGHFDADAQAWYIAPVDRHLDVVDGDGRSVIQDAARHWVKNALLHISTPSVNALREVRLHAVDPIPFARTVAWRDDYATTSLNGLANALAADDRGVVLERGPFNEAMGVQIGDPVTMEINRVVVPFVVVGWMDALPAHNRGLGAFALANLAYVDRVVGRSPWNTLVRLLPDAPAQPLVAPLNDLDIRALRAVDARAAIVEARSDAVLVGTFGLLTLAFVVAAALTLSGFGMHAVLSFRRRVQEFGILRAMGISTRQMAAIVTLEQGFVVVLGTVAGTAIGLVTATLFVPFLQLSAGERDAFPPFIVDSAWDDIAKIYVVFGVLIAAALPLSVWLLRRVRTHEAIKFGEETG